VLYWADVDMAGGRLRVSDAKTDAGVRWIPIPPVLRDELRRAKPAPGMRRTTTTCSDADGRGAVARQHQATDPGQGAQSGRRGRLSPLPTRLTQHSLRHTHISLRVALGDDRAGCRPRGHDGDVPDHAHVMRLQSGDASSCGPARGQCQVGTSADERADPTAEPSGSENAKGPDLRDLSSDSWAGTRTPDLTIMSRAL
jgi:hypothetical protein